MAIIRTIQGHHRLEIPKELREFLGIEIGDQVIVKREGNKLIIEKLNID